MRPHHESMLLLVMCCGQIRCGRTTPTKPCLPLVGFNQCPMVWQEKALLLQWSQRCYMMGTLVGLIVVRFAPMTTLWA